MNTRMERVEAASLLSPALLRQMVEDQHPEIVPLEETQVRWGYQGADDDTLIYTREGVDYLIQPIYEVVDETGAAWYSDFRGYHIEVHGDPLWWSWFCNEDSSKWEQH